MAYAPLDQSEDQGSLVEKMGTLPGKLLGGSRPQTYLLMLLSLITVWVYVSGHRPPGICDGVLWIRTGEITVEGMGSYLTHLGDDVIVHQALGFPVTVSRLQGEPHGYNMAPIFNSHLNPQRCANLANVCELESFTSSVALRHATEDYCLGKNESLLALGEKIKAAECTAVIHNSQLQAEVSTITNVWQTGSATVFTCAPNVIERMMCGSIDSFVADAALYLRWGDAARGLTTWPLNDTSRLVSLETAMRGAELARKESATGRVVLFMEGVPEAMVKGLGGLIDGVYIRGGSDMVTMCALASHEVLVTFGGTLGTLAGSLRKDQKRVFLLDRTKA
ncbi:hypothetical protein P7C70_g1491, partial [Phenoliferia sp. Uapishka_3]